MATRRLVRELVENRDTILGFIMLLTRDSDASEEIFQEVALTVVDEAAKETPVERFLPWVRQIVRHRTADFYRKRGQERSIDEVSDSLVDIVSQAFEENWMLPEASRLQEKYLRECLHGLSARARLLVERRYKDRLPPDRVASSLGWKVDSVHVALSRARRSLFECIEAKAAAQEGGLHG